MKKSAIAVTVFILAVLMVLPVVWGVNLPVDNSTVPGNPLIADGWPLPPGPPNPPATLVADGWPLPPGPPNPPATLVA